MSSRWVYCRHCRQTFVADPGDLCPLCGHVDTLEHAAPPEPSDADQTSWESPVESLDGGTSLGVSCLFVLMGILLGVGVALWGGTTRAQQPEVDIVDAQPQKLSGMAAVMSVLIRLFVGAILGGVAGALGSAAALALAPRLGPRRRGVDGSSHTW